MTHSQSPHIFALALLLATLSSAHAQLKVPAFTAYLDPEPDGARVSQRSGILGLDRPLAQESCGLAKSRRPVN